MSDYGPINYELKSIPNYGKRIFKACLFDMDGLLIDSEPIYTQITSQILQENFDIAEGLSWEVKSKIQGLPGRQASQILIDSYGLHDRTTPEEFEKLAANLQSYYWPKVQLIPGALDLVKYLHESGVPTCVCTSTKEHKFKMKTNHLADFFNMFGGNIVTGDNPKLKGHGKPEPDIWLLGLEKLNEKLRNNESPEIEIEECLIFEDALNGALSGKRAGGYVIWIPDKGNLKILGMKKVNDIIGVNNDSGVLLNNLTEFRSNKFGL